MCNANIKIKIYEQKQNEKKAHGSRVYSSVSGKHGEKGNCDRHGRVLLTAKEFLDYLRKQKGNLIDINYHVTEDVTISKEFTGSEINLGSGVFGKDLSFDDGIQLEALTLVHPVLYGILNFGESRITKVDFGQALVFNEVQFGNLKADTVFCNQATFKDNLYGDHVSAKLFSTGSSTFSETFYLQNLHTTNFDTGESTFKNLDLGDFWTDCFITGYATVVNLEYPIEQNLDPSGERLYKGTPQINAIKSLDPKKRPEDSLATALYIAIADIDKAHNAYK